MCVWKWCILPNDHSNREYDDKPWDFDGTLFSDKPLAPVFYCVLSFYLGLYISLGCPQIANFRWWMIINHQNWEHPTTYYFQTNPHIPYEKWKYLNYQNKDNMGNHGQSNFGHIVSTRGRSICFLGVQKRTIWSFLDMILIFIFLHQFEMLVLQMDWPSYFGRSDLMDSSQHNMTRKKWDIPTLWTLRICDLLVDWEALPSGKRLHNELENHHFFNG